MAIVDLESTAAALVADGKGILAADETPKTLTKRFDASSTRRPIRGRATAKCFLARWIARFISVVIMQYETIHQQSSIRTPFADVLTQQSIIPGIKVDMARNALRARRPRTSRKASMGYAIG